MHPQQTFLTVAGQKVSARLYKPNGEPKKLALLFLHGWTGKPNDRAAATMAEHGFYCLTISMRGHNDSAGDIKQVTANDSLQDAIAAYDFLKQHIPSGVSVVAIGNSYGSYIATLLSGERKLVALSLRVPAAYPDEGFDQPKWGNGSENPNVDTWRHRPVAFSDNKAFRLLHDFKGNVQIIEAENDEAIPHQTVLNYKVAITDPRRLEYILMNSWPHSLGDDPRRNVEFQGILQKWATKVEAEL